MDYLISNILAVMPSGLWEKLIFSFNNVFASFALSIIALTICIKLVMLPIDFINRRTNIKNAEMQSKIKPQVEAIKRKYPDRNIQNQKLGELYKQNSVNPIGSCLVMLVNLGLTLAIFITLLNGLNTMAAYKIQTQYEQLQIAYVQEYVLQKDGLDIEELIENNENKVYETILPYLTEMNDISDNNAKQQIIEKANLNVKQRYKEVKESFLWIDNIWLSDTPFKTSIATFDDYVSVARLSDEIKKDETFKQTYKAIMDPLHESSARVNGFFILVVLSGVVAFLNQWLMTKRLKNKDGTPLPGGGKGMLITMPIIMALFTLLYTSMFSLYIIANQLVSIATIPLINLISDKLDKRKAQKQEPTNRMRRI